MNCDIIIYSMGQLIPGDPALINWRAMPNLPGIFINRDTG